MLPIELRPEGPADFRAVEELTRNAFWNHHAPGCDEHYLAHILRESSDFVPELDYVAVHDGKVVGNIMYTRAKIVLDRGGEREVLCFGPLAVDPAFQGQGVGGALIERTKTLSRELGYKAILIFGDPEYYSRFGFVPAERYGVGTSWGVYIISLQALELQPGALEDCAGYFQESGDYQIDPEASAAFDKGFPPKEKVSGLPSQERFQWIIQQTKPRL
ncbi:MAG: N-acetyltransferase [Oscillospiraceae bacterium]|nr:N-acetyltransferase [Oscillospiraceae bacterium]